MQLKNTKIQYYRLCIFISSSFRLVSSFILMLLFFVLLVGFFFMCVFLLFSWWLCLIYSKFFWFTFLILNILLLSLSFAISYIVVIIAKFTILRWPSFQKIENTFVWSVIRLYLYSYVSLFLSLAFSPSDLLNSKCKWTMLNKKYENYTYPKFLKIKINKTHLLLSSAQSSAYLHTKHILNNEEIPNQSRLDSESTT